MGTAREVSEREAIFYYRIGYGRLQVKMDKRALKEEKKMLKKASKSVKADEEARSLHNPPAGQPAYSA